MRLTDKTLSAITNEETNRILAHARDEWREGKRASPIAGETMLRKDRAAHVETSSGYTLTIDDALKVWRFVKLARRKGIALSKRMLLDGFRYDVSATHKGDLRIGCSLIGWDELRMLAEDLGFPPLNWDRARG